MIKIQFFVAIFIACRVSAHPFESPHSPIKPKPAGVVGVAGGNLAALLLPNISGWGWNGSSTTPPPETTAGWPEPATETEEGSGWDSSPPETTTGWQDEETTTMSSPPGWIPVEYTTETPEPPPTEPTSGWQHEATTTYLPPTTEIPGWGGETSTQGWPTTSYPSTAWPSPPPTSDPGWTSEGSEESIDLLLLGEVAVVGEGEAQASHASHTIVAGDAVNPATAQIQSGSHVSLAQVSGISQGSIISNTGETSTFQHIDGHNTGDAGDYYSGALSGNQIHVINSGGSSVLGHGSVGQGGINLNYAVYNDDGGTETK